VQNNCQDKHKKRKRHRSTDDHEHASCTSVTDVADPAADDAETTASLADIDQSQQCDVEVEGKKKKKKKKKHKLRCNDSMEDSLNSNTSSRQSEEKMIRDCKEATSDSSLISSQNPETFAAARAELDNETASTLDPFEVGLQQGDMAVNGHEHSLQRQTASVTSKLHSDSSMTALSSPAESRVNDDHLVNEELKLSHSAKRRRRRHRGKNSGHSKEGDVRSDERDKKTSAADGSLLQHVLDSNLPAQISHSSTSGFGRTHIIFDSTNCDDETHIKAHTSAQLTCDKHDSGTVEDHNLHCDAVVTDGIVDDGSDAKTLSQHESSTPSGLVYSDVNRDFSATQLSSGTKVRHPAKNAPFANVQVYCRQRIKKSASSTYMPHNQVIDSATCPLPKQASFIHHFYGFYVVPLL